MSIPSSKPGLILVLIKDTQCHWLEEAKPRGQAIIIELQWQQFRSAVPVQPVETQRNDSDSRLEMTRKRQGQ